MNKKYLLLFLFSAIAINTMAQLYAKSTINREFEQLMVTSLRNLPTLKVEKIPTNKNSPYLLRATFSINGLSKHLKINNKTYIFHQIIGQESVIGTFSGTKHILRQGFLQGSAGFTTTQTQFKKKLYAEFYPNPFSQSIKITFDEIISKDILVKVYSMEGREVYSRKFSASQEIQIRTNKIVSGAYILKIINGNKIFTGKLIKK